MYIDEILQKLNELMIKQDMKDKKNKNRELISKVSAYQSLIKLLKEIKKYE